LIIAALLGAMPATAGSRVALVIGNSSYENVPFLPNPINDAADLSAALKRMDFSVRTLTNVRYDEMRKELIAFGERASGADVAVIFFAGHGIQMGGDNWLIPVDARLATDLNVSNEAIGLQSLTRAVSNTARLGLVILDACRINPFVARMTSTNMSRAVDRGFSRVEPSDNVLVAYAARDGTTAADGSGRNSPFTRALLDNVETPGLEVGFLFRKIRDDVLKATNRQQQPFVYGSLSGEQIFLKSSASTEVANAAQQPTPAVPGSTGPGNGGKLFGDKFQPSRDQAAGSSATSAQRVVLYDEDPTDPKGRQYNGTVVWKAERVANSDDIAVKAEIDVPDRKFRMTLAFRRNTDNSLPASHTAEITFKLPNDFVGGGIASFPGILMKSNEQDRGTPLAGLAVKVTDGFFLFGLSNVDTDRSRNLQLLKERAWFDIPLVYSNQRRGIIAIEKGNPGTQAYAQAFAAWGQ
jgi:hypothetical protein